jgi:hypothetical protein
VPIPDLNRQSAAERFRRRARMLAGALLLLAGLILLTDPDLG